MHIMANHKMYKEDYLGSKYYLIQNLLTKKNNNFRNAHHYRVFLLKNKNRLKFINILNSEQISY